jgi:hypothetical protein
MVLALQLAERVYGIAAPGPLFLQFIDSKSRIAGYRQGEHFDPMRKGSDRPVLFMRRTRSRDEPNLIQLRLLTALFRDNQVREVNRVEGTSENADAHPLLPPHGGKPSRAHQ